MSTLEKAAQQALEALEAIDEDPHGTHSFPALSNDAITALRSALAQQEQEPVAWVDEASIAWLAEHPRGIITTRLVLQKSPERQMPLYTAPPRREWKSLADDEIDHLWLLYPCSVKEMDAYARAIEAKLKEKNNG
jgi:hypothetical protein